jgi:gas vesicle protein
MIGRIFNFLVGFTCGFLMSGGAVLLTTPDNGEEFQRKARALFELISVEWQQAYNERRMELEEQLVDLRRGLTK